MIDEKRKALNRRFTAALEYLEDMGLVTRSSHSEMDTTYAQIHVIISGKRGTSRVADWRAEKRFIDYGEAIAFADHFGIDKCWLIFGNPDVKRGDVPEQYYDEPVPEEAEMVPEIPEPIPVPQDKPRESRWLVKNGVLTEIFR